MYVTRIKWVVYFTLVHSLLTFIPNQGTLICPSCQYKPSKSFSLQNNTLDYLDVIVIFYSNDYFLTVSIVQEHCNTHKKIVQQKKLSKIVQQIKFLT